MLHSQLQLYVTRGKSGNPHQQQTTSGAAGEIKGGIHGEGVAAELMEEKARLLKSEARKEKRAKSGEGTPRVYVLEGLHKCRGIWNKMPN